MAFAPHWTFDEIRTLMANKAFDLGNIAEIINAKKKEMTKAGIPSEIGDEMDGLAAALTKLQNELKIVALRASHWREPREANSHS
jgi:hypothetical protein